MAPCCIALLLALGPGAHAQDEEEQDGLPVEIRAIGALVPAREDARALEVYRSLIPRGLEMPSRPQLGVWLSELSVPRNAPGRPSDDASKWIEGAIDIRVRHGEREGWYPIHYPVTAEFWFHAGREVGLPKRHADASFTQNGSGWTARAVPRGTPEPTMLLEWTPGPADPVLVHAGYRLPTDPMFPLNEPFKGPQLMRVQYFLRPPYPFQTAMPGSAPPYSSSAPPEAGFVRVRTLPNIDDLNEDLPDLFGGASLADIVELDQTVPGSHAHYSLTLNSESERIGEGGYDRNGSPAPPPREPRSERRCTSRRSVLIRLPRRRLGRVQKVRAKANGRRVRARLVRPRRARVSMRRLARPGTYRVKVVAYGTYGRRVEVTRRYRLCG